MMAVVREIFLMQLANGVCRRGDSCEIRKFCNNFQFLELNILKNFLNNLKFIYVHMCFDLQKHKGFYCGQS